MQKKVNVLIRLHETRQEKSKTASYSEPIQVQSILISLNALFELHMKSKKWGKYWQNLLLKKGKAMITETLHLVTNIFEDDSFSR